VALRRAVAASKTFDRRRTVVDGTVIEWRRSTTRPRRPDLPVVLLPGVSLSGRYLLPLAAELDGDFPVHLPDPPGFAGSDAPEAGMAMEAQADVLASWMSAIGVSRAHVIANSMGCQIATHLAVRHPRRVAGLVLQGPTVDPQSRSLMGQLGRLVLDALQEPVSIGPSHLFDWARSGPRAAATTVRVLLADRMEDRLPAVDCPTLVVRGTRDPLVSEHWARTMVALLPRGHLHTVPMGRHSMPYSHPVELARIVRPFVGGS
jgi:2-hydroxy-6-oxonona-2,4-dienedioate hydrolase